MQKEYFIAQYYKLTIDETGIDKEVSTWGFNSPSFKVELLERFHRMFRCIVENPEALNKVLEYEVLAHHDSETGADSYVEEYYEKEYSLLDVLKNLSCFSPADAAWLRDGKVDADGLREGLGAGFSIKPSGFEVEESPKP